MGKNPGWSVDVKSLSTPELVSLALDLKGTDYDVVDDLRRELIERLKALGKSQNEIIRYLGLNVVRGLKFNEIAQVWAKIFGITVAEFKRIADAK